MDLLKEIKTKYNLISKFALAQYEFEKILGFKKAIKLTLEEKQKVCGYKCLSKYSNSKIKCLLKNLRHLYIHLNKGV